MKFGGPPNGGGGGAPDPLDSPLICLLRNFPSDIRHLVRNRSLIIGRVATKREREGLGQDRFYPYIKKLIFIGIIGVWFLWKAQRTYFIFSMLDATA